MSIAITTSRPPDRPPAGPGGGPRDYWNARATRFASVGGGLAAVCSYGMPEYHNRYLHWQQAHALAPWLTMPAGTRVLEIGCGVGRWTHRLARAAGSVVAFDLSSTMIGEARRRAAEAGVDGSCRWFVADAAEFSLAGEFDRIVGVTVLQHILDERRFKAAVENIARHLAPGGRALLLEAAPASATRRCDSSVFVARSEQAYLDAFQQAGLTCRAMVGIDPAPFRNWILPYYRSAPRVLAAAALLAATALSVPVDSFAPPSLQRRAWHKVFVVERPRGRP